MSIVKQSSIVSQIVSSPNVLVLTQKNTHVICVCVGHSSLSCTVLKIIHLHEDVVMVTTINTLHKNLINFPFFLRCSKLKILLRKQAWVLLPSRAPSPNLIYRSSQMSNNFFGLLF